MGRATLGGKRSAEEWVAEDLTDGDWAAVSAAVQKRMTELGLNQENVIERSRLAKQTVGEIEKNTEQRNRSPRTLEALSAALEWNPGHLLALVKRQAPPEVGAPYSRSAKDIAGRLDVLEYRVDRLIERIGEADSAAADRYDELRSEVTTELRRMSHYLRQLNR